MTAHAADALISELHGRRDAVVAQVLARNHDAWSALSEGDRQRVESLARAVAARLLLEPETRLALLENEERSMLYANALRELFGLESG